MTYYAQMVLVGTLASRPTYGIFGRLYFATDTGFWYEDTGSAWQQLIPVPAQYTYSTLPGSPILGQTVVVTDSTVNTWGTAITVGGGTDKVLAWYNGTAWTVIGK